MRFDPELQNKYEEATIREASDKQNDIREETEAIGNIYKNPTQKVQAKVSHRTKDNKAAKRDIDHQEKDFRKPDKVLPCPRCNSLETKFCYFNNYNVNQPRHFCKNCHRYWTAGGIIRNVPVGAGKRKNKHSSLQYSQVAMGPDVVSMTQTDSIHASHMHSSSSGFPASSRTVGGTEFMRDMLLCESLQTRLNLRGQKNIEIDSFTDRIVAEEASSSSSRTSCSKENENSENRAQPALLPQICSDVNPLHAVQYYPVLPWACQWNPSWNSMVFGPKSITSTAGFMGSTTMMVVPSFCTPTVELPVAPSSYWGSFPIAAGQKEDSQLVGSAISGIPSPSSSASYSSCSGNSCPTLGKHSRDANTQAEDATKQFLWVPKTLRINDPEEAARSSIWSKLDAHPEQNKPIMRGGVFKSFKPNMSDASSHVLDTNQVLRANPAALSRSESFQERT